MSYIRNGRRPMGAVTLVRDHRAGATVPEYVRREGETRAAAQARANADPAAAAAEAAQYKPGYKPPQAPSVPQDPGGGYLSPDPAFLGIPSTYLLLGGGALVLLLLLRRKRDSSSASPAVVPSP